MHAIYLVIVHGHVFTFAFLNKLWPMKSKYVLKILRIKEI